jgi:hypothetical protein
MEDSTQNSLIFPESDEWELILKSHVPLSGVVLAVAPYLDQYILTCAGNTVKFVPDDFIDGSLHRICSEKKCFFCLSFLV